MGRPRLFLSTVSDELRTVRKQAAATVRTLGFDPVSQDDFPTGHGELRAWLRQQIKSCEGLLQIVGQAYGAEPREPDPEFGRVSYTQYEFLYASSLKKKTWVIIAGENCRRDKPPAELDLPRDPAVTDPLAYQAERRQLQQDYVARLRADNHIRNHAANDTELENIVFKLHDEMKALREQSERRFKLLAAAVLVLLLMGAAGFWQLGNVKRETSSDPRKELENLGITWTRENFEKVVKSGDLRAAELFLQSGMSANLLLLREDWGSGGISMPSQKFLLTLAIGNKNVAFADALRLFQRFKLDFLTPYKGFRGMRTMQEDLFDAAAVAKDTAAVRALKQANADPARVIAMWRAVAAPASSYADRERKYQDLYERGILTKLELSMCLRTYESSYPDELTQQYADGLALFLSALGGGQMGAAPPTVAAVATDEHRQASPGQGALPAQPPDPSRLSMKEAFDRATESFNRQDYQKAIQYYEQAAAKGSRNAEVNLANMYLEGQGGPVDYAEAREHLEKAAAKGDMHAQFDLGLMYAKGEGCPVNYVESVHWFNAAALQGDPDSEYLLGTAYYDGYGITKDRQVGQTWIEKAASAGSVQARTWLSRAKK